MTTNRPHQQDVGVATADGSQQVVLELRETSYLWAYIAVCAAAVVLATSVNTYALHAGASILATWGGLAIVGVIAFVSLALLAQVELRASLLARGKYGVYLHGLQDGVLLQAKDDRSLSRKTREAIGQHLFWYPRPASNEPSFDGGEP